MEHEVSWSIASIFKPYSRESKKCQLCNMEKTLIANQDPARALNRRWEIMTRCRHRDSHLLTNWVSLCQQQQGLPHQELPQVAVEQDEVIQGGPGQVLPVQGEYQNEGGGVQARAGGIGTGSKGAGEFASPVTRLRVNGKKVL